jgi:hypothetical protein
MKLLNKRILQISKSVLLSNLLVGGLYGAVVSSDRFLIKILDRTVSFQDIEFQLRNVKALSCVYDTSMVVQYFEKGFIQELNQFVKKFPKDEIEIKRYLHNNQDILKKVRLYFKMLRYAEDQKAEVSGNLMNILREGVMENKCDKEVLYKETLKTNFLALVELELYLKARYGGQLKNNQRFDTVRSSIDLFVESLDKQFNHEYYW